MHKTDVVRLVAAKLAELAVPRHITRPELEQKQGELATAWELHQQGQTDLEDFT
jgi:hypothetical protein